MSSIMTGLEIVDKAIVGLDGNGYPAAIFQQHRTISLAGAGTSASSAEVDVASSTVLVNVTGLTQQIIPGNYKFRAILPGTASASAGVKFAFNYASCSITSLEAAAKVFTAAGVAVSNTTATTSQSSLAASTTAAILTEIEGTLTVGTVSGPNGTISLQFAQNVSNAATSSVYVGASLNFVKF